MLTRGVRAPTQGIGDDHDIIVMAPDSPLTDIRHSSAGWSCESWVPRTDGHGAMPNCTGLLDRCTTSGPLLFQAPLPHDFLVLDNNGNNGLAVLMPDNRESLVAFDLIRYHAFPMARHRAERRNR